MSSHSIAPIKGYGKIVVMVNQEQDSTDMLALS